MFLEDHCPAEFRSSPTYTHMNQLIKVTRNLQTNLCVCMFYKQALRRLQTLVYYFGQQGEGTTFSTVYNYCPRTCKLKLRAFSKPSVMVRTTSGGETKYQNWWMSQHKIYLVLDLHTLCRFDENVGVLWGINWLNWLRIDLLQEVFIYSRRHVRHVLIWMDALLWDCQTKTPAHAIIKLGRARTIFNRTLIGFFRTKKVIYT